MVVYLLKDVENVGKAGAIVKVADGFAVNYLFAKKLAVRATKGHLDEVEIRKAKGEKSQETLSTKLVGMAEKIKYMHLTIKRRAHDDGKLYGSVSADEIVLMLKEKDITVASKQIIISRNIKAIGEYHVGVKLNSKLIPEFKLKVSAQQKQEEK